MCKKMMRQWGIGLCILGLLFWIAACFWMPVFAEEKTVSFTMNCQTENVTISGMQWKLYRVGERIPESNSFVLQDDFADYDVAMEDLTSSALQDAADTLENYAVLDNISPLLSGVTDQSGALCFEGMSKGLYLLSGKSKMIGDKRYIPSAVLVDLSDKETNLDFMTYPKFRVRKMPSSENEMYTVQKVWLHDEEYPDDRSTELTVAIYRDAQLEEEVKLNEQNNWTYQWTGSVASEWRVKEVEVPGNYTVIYRANDTQYVILNSHSTVRSSMVTPLVTTEITTSLETEISSLSSSSQSKTETFPMTISSDSGSRNSSGGGSSGRKLPQTGQLWWPVPLLIGGGLICIVIGWRMHQKK